MKRIWLGGPLDGGEVEVPDGATTFRYPVAKEAKPLLFQEKLESLEAYDTVTCRVTSKFVLWPYPRKEKANG